MSLTHYQRFRGSGWQGWVHCDWQGILGQRDPLNRFLGWTGQLVHKRPMSCTWRIDAPSHCVFVKLVSSANRQDITRGRWEAQLKQSFGPSVALRTHRMSQRMLDCGLQVPKLLIAAHRRQRWHRDDLLATKEVVGLPLAEVLTNGHGQQAIDETFRMVGHRIALMHQKGFVHGHLVPGHVIVTPDHTNVWFLDNDETCWRPGGVRDSDRRYNLTQLVSRLGAGQYPDAPGAVRCLIEAYFDAVGVVPHQRRRWHCRILNSVRLRNQKRQRRQLYNPLSPQPKAAAVSKRIAPI